MKEKHGLTLKQLAELYNASETISIPASIFSFNLSPSEAICKYLKENFELNYHEIGEILNRDERGIWSSYNRAIKKKKEKFDIKDKEYLIPISIFSNRKLSILENVVYYLSNLHLKNKQIAKLLNKNPAVVSTTLKRAKTKNA